MMGKMIGMKAVLLASFMAFAANAAINISTVGGGSGYDETTLPGFRSTDVVKSFDADGDNIYGTEGVFFFGTDGPAGNNKPFAGNTTSAGAIWVISYNEGADFLSITEQAYYGPYDNPTLSGATVADWAIPGLAVAAGGNGINSWSEILTFTIDVTTPQQFRIGIMSGTQQDTNGRWDPTGLRLSVDGGTATTITGLANNGNSNPEWVFFDVDLNGETSGTFSIEGQQRLSTQGIGISGVTFDAFPTDAPTGFIHYRGIDQYTGGSHRSTSVDKILMADGDAVYGTDGHLFFNVTPLGGTGSGGEPPLNNAVQVLPGYVSSITPAAGLASARDYGYLAIDDPTAPVSSVVTDVESGVLVAGVGDAAGTLHAFLSVEFNGAVPANGVRLGVLVNSADGPDLVPESLRLGATAASAVSGTIPSDLTGSWVFFDLDAAASNQTVTLYGTKGTSNPMTIGGVVFDTLVSALPEVNVFTAAHTDTAGIGALGWSVDQMDSLSILDPDGLPIAGASGALGKQEVSYSGGEIYTLVTENSGTRILETCSTPTSSAPVGVGPGTFTYSSVTVSDDGTAVGRRDVSDVIKVGDTWHVWYSRVLASSPLYPSGYDATIWHSTSTNSGHSWVEQGESVPRGAVGEWDEQSVFTPNIIFHAGTYYLYFTGIWDSDGDGSINDEKTAIGVATSSSPYGPWTKFAGNPVLETSSVASQFDSFRVDDACMAVRNGKVWFYYKGRSVNGSSTTTKMGVAVATNGVGPFVRQNGGDPVQLGGHEVQIWVDENEGVFSMVNNVAPAGLKNTIQYAADGLVFEKYSDLTTPLPEAPGLYRRELTDPTAGGRPDWGIDGKATLGRYEIDIPVPEVTFEFSAVSGVGPEAGIYRRDPSDVIKVGNTWHVWYSKPEGAANGPATIGHATSTDAGLNWTEQPTAIQRGVNSWDSDSAFTPNILLHEGTYYLYYTGVGPNYWTTSGYTEDQKFRIGVASSDSPYGPWTKYAGNPVLIPSADTTKFDSFRVDDACLAVRDGKIWFYHKGRPWGMTSSQTKMGVVIADDPLGPFVRQNGGDPVQLGGHEVQIWMDKHQAVYSLVGSVGPAELTYTIQYAANGMDFRFYADVSTSDPNAPGCYRTELTDPSAGGMPEWGMYGVSSLARFSFDYHQNTSSRIQLDPASIIEGNRLDDWIGDLSIYGGSGYSYELLPIINTNAFLVASDAVSANTVFDAAVTNQVGLFVRAESVESGVIDAFFDVDVLAASGVRKWRLDQFGSEVLGQPELESSVWGDSANPDMDAFANMDEYLADTLPQDSNSVFRIESLSLVGTSLDLSWIGGVNATQYIESCTALTSNTVWTVVATNLPPTAVSNIWNQVVPVEIDSAMYRIKAAR